MALDEKCIALDFLSDFVVEFKWLKRCQVIAGTYPYYPNFAIITSTSWKIRAKNPNIREVDYGNTPCYSGKAACDLDRDYMS